jgi:deoxyribonuclease I
VIKKIGYLTTLVLIFSFGPLALGVADLPPYYPTSFRQALDEHQDAQKIRRALFEVLSKAHLSTPERPDELSEECPKKSTICFKHRPLDYRVARTQIFGKLHLKGSEGNFTLKDVYCSHELGAKDFPKNQGPGPGRIPSHQVMNTEHTWPQSRFSRKHSKDLQKGDLHILYPVLSGVNSVRSNLPFGEISAVTQNPCKLARRGHTGRGVVAFEPAQEHKGNVARAIFYFSVRYELSIDEDEEEYLRKWAHEDPVDHEERLRNENIFQIQGNRNPFIDHPQLTNYIKDF